MKQRKLSGTNYSSCSADECNGHVNYNFERANIDQMDECRRCTNGNHHIRPQNSVQIKSDKPKNCVVCVAYDAQMNNNSNRYNRRRSQLQQWCCWCPKRSHDDNCNIVQNCSLRIRPNNSSSKFAFHDSIILRPIVIVFALLLFSVQHCIANGQQIESQWNAKNTDTIFDVHKTHYVIQPTIFDGQNQRKILATTRQTNGEHAQHIILEYTHLDKTIVADLFLTRNLLAQSHFLRTQNADGSANIQTFNRSTVDLCQYQGRIRNEPNSNVVLSTCDGVKGMVYDGKHMYAIHSDEIGALDEPHYLFNQIDLDSMHPIVKNAIYAEANSLNTKESKRKVKRAVTKSPAREPYNANKQSSFVELVIVVDNDVYKEMNENLDKIHKYCKDIANIINSLYAPLNIFIALVGVVVWTEKNEIDLSNDGDKTLKNFLNYRRTVLIADHPNDNAQLLTKVQFDGGVVGKALKGPICTYEFSGGISTYHSPIVSVVATTIAHEMGHNFGMEHDTVECKCNDERCIMSASSSSIAPTHWSECSIHQLNMAIHQGVNHCLKNIPKYLFESPTCGNGFIEAGEQCDCGLPKDCKNTCCDPNTCQLYTNATCASGKCCNLETCQYHDAGFKCRSSTGECDLPEYCDGSGEFCPMDYFKRDAEECENGKAYCYNGMCKSRDDQCKLLWGPSGTSSEQCYEKNLDGSRHGNCGYNRSAKVFKNCSREDIFCGMMQCRHLNERLEFGLESVAVLSHSFITYGGNIIPCRTAVIDVGLDAVDPGLAPDGSKCGDGKMCVSQRCVAIETQRLDGKANGCSTDCNKRGVCNNMGHCHCDKGFAPPNCDSPGPGGSIDSGPATNPAIGHGIARVLYVFFLGVVPFISVSLLLYFKFWREKCPWFISQTANDLKVSVRHYPDRPAPPLPPSGPQQQLSPSSTDDMNATLLKAHNGKKESVDLKRELFGSFKGFSLKPLPMSKPNIMGAANVAYVTPVAKAETVNEQCIPSRAAPLPPPPSTVVATAPTNSQKKSQNKPAPKLSPSSPYRYQNINATSKDSPETPIEVKLFASKSDAKERPKISHPVLENSTVSVKDLLATANSTHPKVHNQKPHNQVSSTLEKGAINKNAIKKLDISAPIKSVTFGRSQSMRSPSSEKAPAKRNVLASGSMRYPPGKRPKNPPPPRPNAAHALTTANNAPLRNIYSNTNEDGNLSSANSSDNIYCVIEDVKESPPQNGLLSEIVNEIENRNTNSIYSTSKNQRKHATNAIEPTTYENVGKAGTREKTGAQNDNLYMNTADVVAEPIENGLPKPNNVSSIAKKLAASSTAFGIGSAKPTIAAKPQTISSTTNSNSSSASSKETNQTDSTKKPYTKPVYATAVGKPRTTVGKTANALPGKATINPTSTVRQMHKRFESRNS